MEYIDGRIVEYNTKLVDIEMSTNNTTSDKYYNKKLIFNAYTLYPAMFDEVIKAVNNYNEKAYDKFRFVLFNSIMYDLDKFTGDMKFDIKNGKSSEKFTIVNSFGHSDDIKNPVWNIHTGSWVEKDSNCLHTPGILHDIENLVLTNIKKSVMVVLRNVDGAVLCVEHMKCKNKFSLPAGTVECNEDIIDAVVREMKEELNLNLSKFNLELIDNRVSKYDRIDGIKHYNESIFLYDAIVNVNDITNMEPDKHPKLIWINSKEFAEMNKDLFTISTHQILTGGLVKWDI